MNPSTAAIEYTVIGVRLSNREMEYESTRKFLTGYPDGIMPVVRVDGGKNHVYCPLMQ